MKKVILGLVCFLLIISCGFETPKSITIKGNPELYVPLGSPFAGEQYNGRRLEDLISPDYIKSQMNDASDTENIEIYKVSKTTVINTPQLGDYGDVLTYLVEYQLADIPLNFEEYMDKAINNSKETISIPDISDRIPNTPGLPPGTLPSGRYYYIDGDGNLHDHDNEVATNPFLKIPLDDMVNFVNWVERKPVGKLGLEIRANSTYSQDEQEEQLRKLHTYLQLKIPALGIDDYMQGDLDSYSIPSKLLFVNKAAPPPDMKFYPRKDLIDNNGQPNGQLWIYTRISGVCSGIIEPAVVFDWQTAEIDTAKMKNGVIHEEYNIGNSLGEFLGKASFKKVLGYVYIYGVDNDSDLIDMKATFAGKEDNRKLKVIEDPRYEIDPKTNTITESSTFTHSSFYDNTDPMDMTSLFKSESNDKKLQVDITIQQWHITNGDGLKEVIKCKLCVLIPLDLEVNDQLKNTYVNGVNIKNTYVPLNLGDSFLNVRNEDDLFGRKEDDEDNIINNIEYVEIILRDTDKITMTDKTKLAVLVESQNDYKLLEFKEDNASLRFEKEFINPPFSPKFTVLLRKDDKKDSGSFSVLTPDPNKPSKFDFKLDIKAKAALEYSINF